MNSLKMNIKAKFLTFFIGSLTLSSLAILSVNAQTKLTDQSKLYINGLGPVRVGMSVAQASQAAGTQLVSLGEKPNSSCYYVGRPGELQKLGFMVTGNKISRIDIFRESRMTTLKGAKVGDTEAKIKSLYPGQIRVTKHKYTDGNYLTFVPKDYADRNYRVVFETDGQRVIQFRSGKLPEVEWVEGCS